MQHTHRLQGGLYNLFVVVVFFTLNIIANMTHSCAIFFSLDHQIDCREYLFSSSKLDVGQIQQ